MKKTEAHAIDGDDMHFTANCPNCEHPHEYIGYYDSSDVCECHICKCKFTISKLWIDENEYVH